ncbi:MAG: hypothetical protein JXA44_06775 [Methanospirillaceae archaeon]|nr:hypothetical protein [Methanospirillaceae archaeon]
MIPNGTRENSHSSLKGTIKFMAIGESLKYRYYRDPESNLYFRWIKPSHEIDCMIQQSGTVPVS